MKIELVMFILNVLAAGILSFLIQLIAHEFGHMLAGALTGWRLLYLQVFHVALVKENSHLRLKTVPAYGCRCIMYPKGPHQKTSLYTLGGVIMNLILTVAGMAGVIILFNRPFAWMYAFALSISGVMFLITNGIPNIGKVCNDMACMLILRRDRDSEKSHNCQLLIARRLFEGGTYRQIEQSLIEVGDIAINTDILAYHAVLEYYYHLDKDEYMLAINALDRIEMDIPLSQEVRNIIHMERLYIDLVMDLLEQKYTAKDSNRYPEGIESYINEYELKGDIHSVRVRTAAKAYCNYEKGDLGNAIRCLEQGIEKIEGMRYLYLGERIFCTDQLTGLRNMLQRDYLMKGKTGTDC